MASTSNIISRMGHTNRRALRSRGFIEDVQENRPVLIFCLQRPIKLFGGSSFPAKCHSILLEKLYFDNRSLKTSYKFCSVSSGLKPNYHAHSTSDPRKCLVNTNWPRWAQKSRCTHSFVVARVIPSVRKFANLTNFYARRKLQLGPCLVTAPSIYGLKVLGNLRLFAW